jgi:hypothetical protein
VGKNDAPPGDVLEDGVCSFSSTDGTEKSKLLRQM